MISLFLGSPFPQGQALARTPPSPRGEAALAAKAKLALAMARIHCLVEDILALHTLSDDSFSLSSRDHGQEAPREGQAQSCSP